MNLENRKWWKFTKPSFVYFDNVTLFTNKFYDEN